MTKPLCVLLSGPPMCGKGSVKADHLELGFDYLATGECYRQMVDTDSEFGPMVKAFQDQGLLVHDDIHTPLLKQGWWRLLSSNSRHDNSIGLDGAIRTVGQVNAHIHHLKMIMGVYRVVQLLILPAEDELWRRFGIVLSGQDPERVGRNDDRSREVFSTRLREYREKTAPAIELMAEKGIDTATVKVGYNRPKEEMIARARVALGLPMLSLTT